MPGNGKYKKKRYYRRKNGNGNKRANNEMSRGLLDYSSLRFKRINPPTAYYTMEYTNNTTITAPINGAAQGNFHRLNSILSPDLSGDVSVMGFENIFSPNVPADALYRKWVVLKTVISVDIVHKPGSANSVWCGIYIASDNTAITDAERLRGIKNHSVTSFLGGQGNDGMVRLRTTVDQAKWNNKDVRDDIAYAGTAAAHPTVQNYFVPWVANTDTTAAATAYDVSIRASYKIMAFEPQLLQQGEDLS